jgi:hypothetical protein
MNAPPLSVFDGKLWVHYGQAYVLAPECDMLLPEDAFAGLCNGLCGAAVPGGLFLTTGLHTGYVNLKIQVHFTEVPFSSEWEEVVEASWSISSGPVVLEDWDARKVTEIPLEPGSYRVRYAAKRFGEAPEGDGEKGESPIESYLLTFWPAARSPDVVLRQCSEKAAYWNSGGWPTMRRS